MTVQVPPELHTIDGWPEQEKKRLEGGSAEMVRLGNVCRTGTVRFIRTLMAATPSRTMPTIFFKAKSFRSRFFCYSALDLYAQFFSSFEALTELILRNLITITSNIEVR
jgi:hypothetical protein